MIGIMISKLILAIIFAAYVSASYPPPVISIVDSFVHSVSSYLK